MRIVTFILLVVILVCKSSQVNSQINFTATVSPEKIGRDDFLTLRYTVSGSLNIDHIYPPDFKDFQLISGPDSESSEVNINGKIRRSYSFIFILKPVKAGRILLPGASAMVAGKEYKSNDIEVHVQDVATVRSDKRSNDSDADFLSPGEDLDEKIAENMFMRLETDKRNVYVGEPVLAKFKLYSRLRSNSRLTQNPSFNGFSVNDLQSSTDVTESGTEMIKGKEYNVYIIRKVLLYPLQPGTFTIEPLELENNVQFLEPIEAADPYDIFSMLNRGYGTTISKRVTLSTEPYDISVKPLPAKDKPADFSGAVGEYHITCSILQDHFKANEEGRLLVEISGKGNLQLVNAPVVQWPAGVDAFDPTMHDTMIKGSSSSLGRKTFEYIFSVVRPGEYEIPPVSFNYFNPEKARYEKSESNALKFFASPAAASTANVPVVQKKNAANKYLWLLVPAAAGAILLLFIIFRSLRKETTEKMLVVTKDIREEPQLIPKKLPLQDSSAALEKCDSKTFYPVLSTELKRWLSEKFCVEANEITSVKLKHCMVEAAVPDHLVNECLDLIREIEWQLYVPGDGTGVMQQHFKRAENLVAELTNYVRDA